MVFPFELWILTEISSEKIKDGNGFDINPDSDWVKLCDCYEQVLGAGRIAYKDNGESFSYSSKIFLPEISEVIADGTKIQVRKNGRVRFEGTSKRFVHDFMHCRIWA